MITAAILAGGRARRFGGSDKAMLPIGPARIIDRQVDELRTVADHILIVAGPGRYAALGVPVYGDLVPGAGALGGIYTALVIAPTARVLVLACDMPFVSAHFLRYLHAADPAAEITIPRTVDGYQPLCAVYDRACASALRRRIDAGALQVQGLLADFRVREIGPEDIAPFDPDGTLFLNVNTPDDYARAVAAARLEQPRSATMRSR